MRFPIVVYRMLSTYFVTGTDGTYNEVLVNASHIVVSFDKSLVIPCFFLDFGDNLMHFGGDLKALSLRVLSAHGLTGDLPFENRQSTSPKSPAARSPRKTRSDRYLPPPIQMSGTSLIHDDTGSISVLNDISSEILAPQKRKSLDPSGPPKSIFLNFRYSDTSAAQCNWQKPASVKYECYQNQTLKC